MKLFKKITRNNTSGDSNTITVKMDDIARWEQERLHTLTAWLLNGIAKVLIHQRVNEVENIFAQSIRDNHRIESLQLGECVLDVTACTVQQSYLSVRLYPNPKKTRAVSQPRVLVLTKVRSHIP